jgi:uncharacterized repeat protein (TIGR01451 family)
MRRLMHFLDRNWLLNKVGPTCRRKAPKYRPLVEHLEIREVPAVIGVDNPPGGVSPENPPGGGAPTPGISISKSVVSVGDGQIVDDCIALFRQLGPNVTSGAPRLKGKGQLKYRVCHHTGSETNPFVLINVAAPAAFGGHLRHGDLVFIRRTPGGPLTTVQLNAKNQLVVSGPDQGPFPTRRDYQIVRQRASSNGTAGVSFQVGDEIRYSIVVANTGNVALTGVTVTDQVENYAPTTPILVGGDVNNNDVLDVGEIWQYTSTYTLTQEDLDNNAGGDGLLTNVAIADSEETPPVSDSESVPLAPGLSISKTVSAVNDALEEANCIALFQQLGADVTSGAARLHGKGQLKYWVCHHTGSATNPFVLINVAAPAAFGAHLRHGDIVFIRRTPGGPLTTVRLNAQGKLIVNGPDQGPFPVRKNVKVIHRPAIQTGATQQVSAQLQAGDVLTYSIAVANTGNVTLTGLTVTDQVESNAATTATHVSGDVDGDGNLDVGEIWNFTVTYTLTQEDLDSRGGGDGLLDNVAVADTNETAPVQDTASVPLVFDARVAVSKTITAVGGNLVQDDCIALFTSLGTQVTSGAPRLKGKGQLKYWVCHRTGSETNPFVLINVAAPAAFGAHLQHGDIVFIRRTPGGPLTTVTLDASGQLIVNGPDQGPFPVSANVVRVSGHAHNQVSVVGAAAAAGESVQYSITVANTGNITITGLSVTDQLEGSTNLTVTLVSGDIDNDGELDVGEVWTFAAEYLLTQEDLDSSGGGDGLLRNTAIVEAAEIAAVFASVDLVL